MWHLLGSFLKYFLELNEAQKCPHLQGGYIISLILAGFLLKFSVANYRGGVFPEWIYSIDKSHLWRFSEDWEVGFRHFWLLSDEDEQTYGQFVTRISTD